MKETTKIRIGALIAAILLAGMCMAFGQVTVTHRYKERPDIRTISPSVPLQFGKPGAEYNDPTNGRLSLYVDEIGKDSADVILYVYYQKEKVAEAYDAVVQFKDGSFVKLNRTMLIKENNYAEYLVHKEAYNKMVAQGIETILFRNDDKVGMFQTPFYDSAYFYNFLHTCKK